jgi:hypothetical protein
MEEGKERRDKSDRKQKRCVEPGPAGSLHMSGRAPRALKRAGPRDGGSHSSQDRAPVRTGAGKSGESEQ